MELSIVRLIKRSRYGRLFKFKPGSIETCLIRAAWRLVVSTRSRLIGSNDIVSRIGYKCVCFL
jgi:hypothetical protein